MVELLTVLYRDVINYDFNNPEWDDRDVFILSKGHCVIALFALLAECGVIAEDEISSYLENGSLFGAHPGMDIKHGIEASSGSLGQGLSLAVGLAKAAKISGSNKKIYTLVGDGELQEGSVWEAIMLASAWSLDNLTLIVDRNGLQSDGSVEDTIRNLENIEARFEDFGFRVFYVDGHNENEILKAYKSATTGQPKVIIGKTVKGKGVPFAENNNTWHHNRLTPRYYNEAITALENQESQNTMENNDDERL